MDVKLKLLDLNLITGGFQNSLELINCVLLKYQEEVVMWLLYFQLRHTVTLLTMPRLGKIAGTQISSVEAC